MKNDEPINIISLCAKHREIRGPKKVFNNLVKGLDQLGFPYVVNHPFNSTRRLWIQDDLNALSKFSSLDKTTLLGPNLVVLPGELPLNKSYPRSFYLQPSAWARDKWKLEGFDRCPLKVWPVGIDTDEFYARTRGSQDAPILVYYKSRAPEQLELLKRTLDRKRMPYKLITYGKYQEKEYKELLHQCSFMIWLGCHESQGIALQEALSAGVPILVLNATSLFDEYPLRADRFPERLRNLKITSAPYFDERCGIIINSMAMLEESLSQMHQRFDKFNPREFILENLSLKKQAQEFYNYFLELEAASPRVPMGFGNRPFLKLHLGCGQNYLKGYVNIDYPIDHHSVQEKSVADIYGDILELRYPFETIDEIRLHHVFEHFRRPVACALLAGWQSWLRPGGKLHIEVPDLYASAKVISSPGGSPKLKMVTERHLFGSHEAGWADHFEGYSPDLLTSMAGVYGFQKCHIQEFQYHGLHSFALIAEKKGHSLSREECRKVTEKFLSNFLVDVSPSELKMLEVWLASYQYQAEKLWASHE